jgi:tRNA(fMet)-specific endonuclease VapC
LIRLLDTNTCIHIIRRRHPDVLRRLESHDVGDVGVSSITVAELRFGAEKSARPSQNHEALDRFLIPLEIAGFDGSAASAYGRVRRALLEARGTPIGPLDTLIAAHAVSLHTTLATNNVREFGRVPGLEVEDWTVGTG